MPGVRPGALLGHTPGLWTPPGSAASAAFSPSSLPNLAGWWKADAGTSTTTDGVAISQWNDQSSNARHLLQATGVNQPLYKAAIQNGLPVVRFDGANDFMRATFALVQPAYFFIVASYRVAFTVNAVLLCGAAAGASGDAQIYRNASTTYQLFAGSNACLLTTTPQAFHVLGAGFAGASSETRADGGVASTGNPGADGSGGVTLAADNAGGQASGVDIGEVIAVAATPSAGDRASTEAYLKAKWGTP